MSLIHSSKQTISAATPIVKGLLVIMGFKRFTYFFVYIFVTTTHETR